ncbi:MAG TPA: hypothetical protein VHO01_11965 [Jatrophihabitans sp.]|nr:hypothetical protein [Jatrophihabitans sp.]
MNGRKIIGLLLIAFLLFYVFNNPSDAASLAKDIQHLLSRFFSSFTKFLDGLTH